MADNITKPQHLRGPSAQGTGIYWLNASTGHVLKLFVPRITSEQAGQIATDLERPGGTQGLDAYRWVPDDVETADSLISTLSGARCRSDIDCRDNACKCINNICQ
jgi:hypothetical protein